MAFDAIWFDWEPIDVFYYTRIPWLSRVGGENLR